MLFTKKRLLHIYISFILTKTIFLNILATENERIFGTWKKQRITSKARVGISSNIKGKSSKGRTKRFFNINQIFLFLLFLALGRFKWTAKPVWFRTQ